MGWPDSDHCQNGRFFTPHAPQQPGFRAILEWLTHREKSAWQEWISASRGTPPPERLAAGELRVTFVNHATVLLQIGELNVITDPIWSDRASPVQFAGPRRHRAPGIRFEDLLPIDVILISHNHYDHLDTRTLRRFRRRDAPTIYCPLGVAARLRRLGFHSIVELDWWQHQPFREVVFHCVPAQHFSARGLFDRNRTLWCGWQIEYASGGILFAGDTGFGPHFSEIAARFPAPRVALLPHWSLPSTMVYGPSAHGPRRGARGTCHSQTPDEHAHPLRHFLAGRRWRE